MLLLDCRQNVEQHVPETHLKETRLAHYINNFLVDEISSESCTEYHSVYCGVSTLSRGCWKPSMASTHPEADKLLMNSRFSLCIPTDKAAAGQIGSR